MYPQIGDAVPSVGSPLYLILDQTIVAECRAIVGQGAEVSVIFNADFFDKTIRPMWKGAFDAPSGHHVSKFVFFIYGAFTGLYIGANFDDEEPELEKWLQRTRVVDKRYFEMGLVPDHFKTVEGYRKMFADDDEFVDEAKDV